MDYASESDVECGLEEQYYSAKEVLVSGSVEEAIPALETVVEMDVDHTQWGFKALKRIVKSLIHKNHEQALDYYGRLFAYVSSRAITTNDADKALDSLWNRYYEAVTDADARRIYCLTTVTNLQVWRTCKLYHSCDSLQIFPGRLTCLKWLARLAQQCSAEDHQRQLEGREDTFQQVIEDALTMDDISDVAKTYFVDALSLTALLFLRHRRLAQVENNLDNLGKVAVDTDRAVECEAFIKGTASKARNRLVHHLEMKARLAFIRGRYAASFELLWAAKRLYEECQSTNLLRIHMHLRLMSLLLPKVGDHTVRITDRTYAIHTNHALSTTEWARVKEIVQCFNDGDVAGLRSTTKDAQAELGHFAAVELCGALIRNQLFRRMAHENVLDTFACLPRWDVDALHPVGRRLSNFVEVNSRSLPLKNISKVSLKKVTEESFDHYRRHWTAIDRIQLTVQTEHGSTTFCKKPSYDQKYDVSTIMLDIRPALGQIRSLLANAFVELLDLDETVWSSTLHVPPNNSPLLRIKRHTFGRSYPRLLPLQAFGEVSVEHVDIRFPELSRAPTDFFGPLAGAEVSHLCRSALITTAKGLRRASGSTTHAWAGII
ncbi:CSN-2 protein [Aphelenchoides avenae]|nr:CSN-2 protein [Aphelenchus avenae]